MIVIQLVTKPIAFLLQFKNLEYAVLTVIE